MSRATVITVRFTCDHCPATEDVTGVNISPPSGWAKKTSGGWGMTNYSKTEDLCPRCAAETPRHDEYCPCAKCAEGKQ